METEGTERLQQTLSSLASRRAALGSLAGGGGIALLTAAGRGARPAAAQDAATPAIALDANKDLVRRFYEAVNRRDDTALEALLTPGFVDRLGVLGDPTKPGPQAMAKAVADLHGAFPDARATVEEVIAEGDRVAARIAWRGTAPAPYEARQFDFWGVAGGRLTELVRLFDSAGLDKQLAAAATPAATPIP